MNAYPMYPNGSKVFHIMRVPYLNLKIHSYVKLFNEFLKNVANLK